MTKIISTKNAPKAIGPYSQGVIFGDIIFVSGQIPFNPKTGAMVEGGIENQTEQVLKNVEGVLGEVGASFEDVLKATLFLKDINMFEKINNVYSKFFKEPYPARSTVEVSRLPKDVLIEIEVIAKYKN